MPRQLPKVVFCKRLQGGNNRLIPGRELAYCAVPFLVYGVAECELRESVTTLNVLSRAP